MRAGKRETKNLIGVRGLTKLMIISGLPIALIMASILIYISRAQERQTLMEIIKNGTGCIS